MASLGAANDISGTLCPRCTDKGTLTCSRCNDIKYCSAECQRADWATHKVLCGAIKDLGPRPSKDMRRILAFLPDEEKPRFVWAPLMQNLFSRHESVDISSFFEPAPMYRQKPQVKNPWTNGTLGYGLDILFDDDFSHAYSNDNRAVVAATKGANTFSWRGPVFAYCARLGDGMFDKNDIVDIRDMSIAGVRSRRRQLDRLSQQGPSARAAQRPENRLRQGRLRQRSSAQRAVPPGRPSPALAPHLRTRRLRLFRVRGHHPLLEP